MKKKAQAREDTVVPDQILELARRAAETEKLRLTRRCTVCGSDFTRATSGPKQEEDLCWVCRRLKISAWRETDQQIAAQE